MSATTQPRRLQETIAHVQQWEYATDPVRNKDKDARAYIATQMPARGTQGWELVSVCPVASANLNGGSPTEVLLYTYKRPAPTGG